MTASRLAAAPILVALALILPEAACAQSTGGRGQTPDGDNSAFTPPEFYPAPPDGPRGTVSVETTDLILRDLSEARDFCARSPRVEYVIDCLAEELGRISAKMPRGDYAPARETIARAARDLGALAAANPDRALPRARLRRPGGKATPPLTPVRSDAVDQLNAAAADIMAEAETRLLRSAERSEQRMVHYRRIAAAAGSTKVLLRSL